MGPPPFTRGVRGWVSVSNLKRLVSRVCAAGLVSRICPGGPYKSVQWTVMGWRDHNLWGDHHGVIASTILDVITIIV